MDEFPIWVGVLLFANWAFHGHWMRPDCASMHLMIMDKLPTELRDTLELFTRVAMKHGFLFAGMMIYTQVDPSAPVPFCAAIGNVKERGHDFAELLRKFASIMDEATDQGVIVDNRISKPM